MWWTGPLRIEQTDQNKTKQNKIQQAGQTTRVDTTCLNLTEKSRVEHNKPQQTDRYLHLDRTEQNKAQPQQTRSAHLNWTEQGRADHIKAFVYFFISRLLHLRQLSFLPLLFRREVCLRVTRRSSLGPEPAPAMTTRQSQQQGQAKMQHVAGETTAIHSFILSATITNAPTPFPQAAMSR